MSSIILCMSEPHSPLYEAHAEVASAEELQLLKQQEPFVDFRVVGATEAGLSTGRQSRVSVLEYGRGQETYKVLWKRMAAGKGLTEEEATLLNARLEPYREDLMRSGWNVPKLFHHRVSSLQGESQIFSYEEYIPGGDGEKMLQDSTQPNFRKWFLVEEVARTLAAYDPAKLSRTELAGKTVTKLPHGLDLKLANVVLSGADDTLYFVDLFGPKEIAEDGKWRTFSPKLDGLEPDALMAVTASREGSILRCWRLAENNWNNGYQDVNVLRADFLAHLDAVGLPREEFGFIRQEIESGYPWLDAIYQERKV